MSTLLPAILTASLVGSVHCAGMCGPLVAFVVGGGDAPAGRRGALRLQAAYHLARGAGYATLGLVLGLVGHLVDIAGVLAGLAPLAATLAGVTLLLTGLALLARHLGAHVPKAHLPAPLQAAVRRMQARALRLPPTARALAVGASTTLLPCGWLYAFAVTAAGTGAPLAGAAVMGAFWLGTVPILGLVGVGVQGIKGALGPTLQVAASVALLLLGAWTLVGRARLDAELLVDRVERAAPAAGAVPDTGAPPACCAPLDPREGETSR